MPLGQTPITSTPAGNRAPRFSRCAGRKPWENRDQQQHQVGFADHLEHLAERSIALAKPGHPSRGERARATAQADLDADRGASERVPQILRLGLPLWAPADHADLPYAGEGSGQQGKQVSSAAHHGFSLQPRDRLRGEDPALQPELLRHVRLPARSRPASPSACRAMSSRGLARGEYCVK
jgi:hypothetical protein